MRDVWVAIPTACQIHVEEHLAKWRKQGYKVAIQRESDIKLNRALNVDSFADAVLRLGKYPGVWKSWNALAKMVMSIGADVVVLAGDDMLPDPNLDAQQIAERYFKHFPSGNGVYQPTGDNQGEIIGGRWNSQRICGSPWVGREWCARAYLGNGPVDGRYWAFYSDEQLQEVAQKHGLFVQDPDVSQWHRHWSWPKNGLPKQPYHDRNQAFWDADKAIFEASKAAGFPEAKFLGEAEYQFGEAQ